MKEEVKSIILSRQKAEATIRQALIEFMSATKSPLCSFETQVIHDLKINTRLPIVK